jgi:hypothetical protein
MRDSGKKSSQKLLVRPSLTYEAPRTQYVETRGKWSQGSTFINLFPSETYLAFKFTAYKARR